MNKIIGDRITTYTQMAGFIENTKLVFITNKIIKPTNSFPYSRNLC